MAAAVALLTWSAGAQAQWLGDRAEVFKPFVVEYAGKALTRAKELQAAVKAGDVKAAQAAWIKSAPRLVRPQALLNDVSKLAYEIGESNRRAASRPTRRPPTSICRRISKGWKPAGNWCSSQR